MFGPHTLEVTPFHAYARNSSPLHLHHPQREILQQPFNMAMRRMMKKAAAAPAAPMKKMMKRFLQQGKISAPNHPESP